MANLAAALMVKPHLEGPICRQPVLLRGSGCGRAQGGRLFSRPPVVELPAKPWVGAAAGQGVQVGIGGSGGGFAGAGGGRVLGGRMWGRGGGGFASRPH